MLSTIDEWEAAYVDRAARLFERDKNFRIAAKHLFLNFWIKNINAENWQQYAFTFRPHEQPKDINSVRVFGFPNKSPYSNPEFCEVVIGKSDCKPYIRYSVANGHSGHDPWFVSVSQPVTFEDVHILAEELKLSKYIDINEANWMDKIETFGGSNVYQISNNLHRMKPFEAGIWSVGR